MQTAKTVKDKTLQEQQAAVQRSRGELAALQRSLAEAQASLGATQATHRSSLAAANSGRKELQVGPGASAQLLQLSRALCAGPSVHCLFGFRAICTYQSCIWHGLLWQDYSYVMNCMHELSRHLTQLQSLLVPAHALTFMLTCLNAGILTVLLCMCQDKLGNLERELEWVRGELEEERTAAVRRGKDAAARAKEADAAATRLKSLHKEDLKRAQRDKQHLADRVQVQI